jgi:hypothetical protein
MNLSLLLQRFAEPRLWVPALLVLFSAVLPAIGYFAYGYDLKVLGFPLGIGLFAIAMGLLSIRAEWRTQEVRAAPAPTTTSQASISAFDESEGLLADPNTWIQVGWILLFAAVTLTLGFLIGPSTMIALYLLWDGRGWRGAMLAAAMMAAGVWLIATHLIRAQIPLLPVFLQ